MVKNRQPEKLIFWLLFEKIEVLKFNKNNMEIKTDFSNVTDENLFNLCRQYGERARFWRQKFIGLLPEVYKRKLFEKKGFGSIFEFAKKLAGLSEEQVRRVLSLEKRFDKMPVLKSLLVNGEVSVNKLARVASIANQENQEFLAGKVKILSQGAVETLVRDESWARKMEGGDQNGLFDSGIEGESVRTHTSIDVLRLSPEVQQKLLELQQKGIDINNLFLEFLKKREEEIAQKKEKIAKKVLQKEQQKLAQTQKVKGDAMEEVSEYILEKPTILKTRVRSHIPISVVKILKEEYGTKCALKSCQKSAENIHHTLPFAISNSHDPKFLAPLCREHHELAHAVDVNCQKFRWRKYS